MKVRVGKTGSFRPRRKVIGHCRSVRMLPCLMTFCLDPKDPNESDIYHSINLGFDGEVAEKFLNGIYYILE